MARWRTANGFALAPHGKTTMCPRIFRRQMEGGAWAITVATVSQATVCVEADVKRILIANQVVGRANLRSLAKIAKEYVDVELLCVVDSISGIRYLRDAWEELRVGRPIGVL